MRGACWPAEKEKGKGKKKEGEESILDPLWNGIDTAKDWLSGFWGDDGKHDL